MVFPSKNPNCKKNEEVLQQFQTAFKPKELVQVVADCAIEDCKGQDWDAIALPGGEGGARVELLSWTS